MSAYTEVCSLAAQHFGSIREALIEQSVPSTLNVGFLNPCTRFIFFIFSHCANTYGLIFDVKDSHNIA